MPAVIGFEIGKAFDENNYTVDTSADSSSTDIGGGGDFGGGGSSGDW